MDSNTTPPTEIDITLIGGGIAGAWLGNLLLQRGYRVALFEAQGWGSGQTLASQGMIHGGLKYALDGEVGSATDAIAPMPARWRDCLAGKDEIDLTGVPVLADQYMLFAAANTLGKLTSFFASRALRGRINKLDLDAWPESFKGFAGAVYGVEDFVLDTPALMEHLSRPLRPHSYHMALAAEHIEPNDTGFRITTPFGTWQSRYLVSCAGQGSGGLADALGIDDLAVQHRPLKQVIVRPRHTAPMYAHCLSALSGAEPRLTITSHGSGADFVWYLGGALATRGAQLADDELLQTAQQELHTCVPWLDWHGAEYSVLEIDRCEPATPDGGKPDDAHARASKHFAGRFIQCFPTKLTLTPHLGDRVLELLDPPRATGPALEPSAAAVPMAREPWAR